MNTSGEHARMMMVVMAASMCSVANIPDASAMTYTLEYITSWSACDAACSGANSLKYTDDKINYLDSEMSGLGHTKRRG